MQLSNARSDSDLAQLRSTSGKGKSSSFSMGGRGKEFHGMCTHIKIDFSVRAIKDRAFRRRSLLRIMILNEEFDEIGGWAFEESFPMQLRKLRIGNSTTAQG